MISLLRGLSIGLLIVGAAVGCGQSASEADREAANSAPAADTEREADVAAAEDEATEDDEPAGDWQTLNGAGLELSLPEGYTGGDPSTDLDRLASELEAIDPEYAQRIESIRQNPEAIAFLAFDPDSAESGFLTNVNIATEPVPADIDLEQYLEAATQQLAGIYEIESQEITTVGDYEAGKIVGQFGTGELQVKQLFYAIKTDGTFWIVTYATTADEFDTRLPNFERSIQTLKLES